MAAPLTFLISYVLLMATLSDEGGHFEAIFRLKETEWFLYNGMNNTPIRPRGKPTSNPKCLSPYKIGWALYVQLKYVKEEMKKLAREMAQLGDSIPGSYWNETPKRQQRRK